MIAEAALSVVDRDSPDRTIAVVTPQRSALMVGHMNRLRITDHEDHVRDGMDEGTLRSMLVSLRDPGEFLIVDRGAQRTNEGFAQVIVADDRTLVIEFRDGPEGRPQYWAAAPDVGTAHDVLAGWALGRAGWRDRLTWEVVDLGPASAAPAPGGSDTAISADEAVRIKHMGSDPEMSRAIGLPALFSSLLGIPLALLISLFLGSPEIGYWTAVAGYIIGVVVPLIVVVALPLHLLQRVTANTLLGAILAAPPLITAVAIVVLAGSLS